MKEIVKFKGNTRTGFQTDKVPTKRIKDTHFFSLRKTQLKVCVI